MSNPVVDYTVLSARDTSTVTIVELAERLDLTTSEAAALIADLRSNHGLSQTSTTDKYVRHYQVGEVYKALRRRAKGSQPLPSTGGTPVLSNNPAYSQRSGDLRPRAQLAKDEVDIDDDEEDEPEHEPAIDSEVAELA